MGCTEARHGCTPQLHTWVLLFLCARTQVAQARGHLLQVRQIAKAPHGLQPAATLSAMGLW